MDTPTLHLIATIKIKGINPYIDVTNEQATLLKPGWKKPMPVLVQVNGQPNPPWKINMMPMGNGDFYLYLHGNIRKTSRTKVGDKIMVDVTFDESYHNGPLHAMPEWFSKALAEHAKAYKNWEALSPSRKKEILRYFSGLKSTQAQIRNVKRAIAVLSGENERFMGRSWNNGK